MIGLRVGHIQQASLYWDTAAETYEDVFSGTLIGQTRRRAVWRHLERLFRAGDHVLELNCGTGLDAVFLAHRGVTLVACDISPRMVELARQHAGQGEVDACIRFLPLANEDLGQLSINEQFTGAFSNFSGFNCVENLAPIQSELAARLKPGAPLLLCMMGRIVPWEILWFLLHGDARRAIRRFQPDNLAEAAPLTIYRHSLRTIVSQMSPGFTLRRRSSIGIAVPPSYMEHWARRFPRATRFLTSIDGAVGHLPFVRDIGDCLILEFERSGQPK